MFSGWIYDHLKPHAAAIKVAHPLMPRAIAAAKKKNDRIDANKICDCLRCDFLPEYYMAPTAIRERRRTLRYRSLLVRQMVQTKIKISTLLMEAGVSCNKSKLHKAGYFRELLASNPDIDESLRSLLGQCREMVVRLSKMETDLIHSLQQDRLLVERVERLMSIPGIGPITALTWALEIGEVQRFSSIKKAISYCGLCGDEQRSANSVHRTPISKQRNKHLQTTLIEAAKMAPRYSPTLALLYDREKQKGNANRATLAVARKLVARIKKANPRKIEDHGIAFCRDHFSPNSGNETPAPVTLPASIGEFPALRSLEGVEPVQVPTVPMSVKAPVVGSMIYIETLLESAFAT